MRQPKTSQNRIRCNPHFSHGTTEKDNGFSFSLGESLETLAARWGVQLMGSSTIATQLWCRRSVICIL